MTFDIAVVPPRIIAPGGPVAHALRIMLGADPDQARVRELRRSIASRIEADIELLDMLAGDPDLEIEADLEDGGDLERALGWCENVGQLALGNNTDDGEPSLGSVEATNQLIWSSGNGDDREQDAGDEREEENEHGGDIQDEPHDEEPDREPSLCGLTVTADAVFGADGWRDLEIEGDDEPSLGSINPTFGVIGVEVGGVLYRFDGASQLGWAAGGTDDREDGDDNGIADSGGEAEQFGAVYFGSVGELCPVTGQPLVMKNGRLVAEGWA